MKCLVLGAGGYIGRHLAAALRAHGHQVVAAASRAGPAQSRVDVGDAQTLTRLDWAVDVVFLFAGVTGTTASFKDHEGYVKGNELGLLNVLESIRLSSHRPRLVFPSSRLVYKGSRQPLPETAELEAKTVYAANKIACEFHLRAFSNAFDIPHTIFRVCVPYGNSQGSEYSFGTVGNFVRQALETGRISLYGDGSLRRTFTHVDDLCSFMVLGSASADFENGTFNIPGDDLSLLEAAQLIGARLGAAIAFAPWPSFDLCIESGSTVFDGTKTQSRLPSITARNMAQWAATIAPERAGG
jgi:UDP-glucose 4-epimerase